MPLKSMTGFARNEAKLQDAAFLCEIKSVNGRNLDLRLRLPEGHDFLEPFLRQEIGKVLRRGSVSVSISQQKGEGGAVQINRDLVERLAALRAEMGPAFEKGAMKFEQFLTVPGVVQFQSAATSVIEADELWKKLVQPALTAMDQSRRKEGDYLQGVLKNHIASISALVQKAETRLQPQADAMQRRLMEQLAAIGQKANVDEQRVAQELAMMAIKADVREELDRLKSHLQAATDMLKAEDAVGRRLDFLAQEFNREANTLCSKSADIELTKIGLELKNVIDQFREQVQNLE